MYDMAMKDFFLLILVIKDVFQLFYVAVLEFF